jgi:hypothetical protein
MRLFRWTFALVAVFILFSGVAMRAAADDKGDNPRALIESVNPMNVRTGDSVVATGTRMDKKYIAELYLTNGKDDIKVEILKQTEREITFKIPPDLNGRYRLMILTGGIDGQLIEQPVRVVVE